MQLVNRSTAVTHRHQPAAPVRFLRLPEVLTLIGMSRSSMYDAIKRGVFPAPIPLGGKSVAWLSTEIETWMAGRVAARHTH